MDKKNTSRNLIAIGLLLILLTLILSSCSSAGSKTYQHSEIHLNCENYSAVQNDPGNCMVIEGTTEGLRIQLGMIVTKDYVISLMESLGWKKDSQTTKYVDANGQSYKVDVYKFSRELE